jgi:hypothetical protein
MGTSCAVLLKDTRSETLLARWIPRAILPARPLPRKPPQTADICASSLYQDCRPFFSILSIESSSSSLGASCLLLHQGPGIQDRRPILPSSSRRPLDPFESLLQICSMVSGRRIRCMGAPICSAPLAVSRLHDSLRLEQVRFGRRQFSDGSTDRGHWFFCSRVSRPRSRRCCFSAWTLFLAVSYILQFSACWKQS